MTWLFSIVELSAGESRLYQLKDGLRSLQRWSVARDGARATMLSGGSADDAGAAPSHFPS